MPLPVAHSLVGATAVAAVMPREGSRRYYLLLLAGALLANAADLDFVLVFAFGMRGLHRGPTHSLFFALVVCLLLFAALGRRHARRAAAYSLAYATHSLLDFSTTKYGGGLELLWPFSNERFGLRWFSLSELPSLAPSLQILKWLCLEFALFAPPLLLVLWLRRRAAARAEA
ncbi:MAG TPA: metal-dependent hydrolase [Pyrinomonadaceae bacterium]|nr:metal-dependent hydrolase [Pyrinomonadaceae bacterium]